ncbi:MAG: hypothetical protein WC003_12825 [Terrimicrobiaceae bacterium]
MGFQWDEGDRLHHGHLFEITTLSCGSHPAFLQKPERCCQHLRWRLVRHGDDRRIRCGLQRGHGAVRIRRIAGGNVVGFPLCKTPLLADLNGGVQEKFERGIWENGCSNVPPFNNARAVRREVLQLAIYAISHEGMGGDGCNGCIHFSTSEIEGAFIPSNGELNVVLMKRDRQFQGGYQSFDFLLRRWTDLRFQNGPSERSVEEAGIHRHNPEFIGQERSQRALAGGCRTIDGDDVRLQTGK